MLLLATQPALVEQPPKLPVALVATFGACALSASELMLGLDTASQPVALGSLVASYGMSSAARAAFLTDATSLQVENLESLEESPEEQALRESKRAALSARKSWDARLSWKVRKQKRQDGAQK